MFSWNQLLDIVDTVVKIGLGAAISGILTYKLTRLNYDGEIRKTRWLRQCEMLEACGEKAEVYIWAMIHLISAIDGTRVYNDKHNVAKYTEAQWKSIGAIDDTFMESRKEMQSVVARLRLLGAKDAAAELRGIDKLVGKIRDPLMLEKKELTVDEINKLRSEIDNQISKFHDALSRTYDKLNPSLPPT